MAVLPISAAQSFSAGSDVSAYAQGCGFDAGKNRVMRFAFTTGSTGASEIRWKLSYIYMYSWAYPQIPMRFYIGEDPDSHLNAGANTSQYTGDVTVYMDTVYNSESYMEGSAKIRLKANTTYYLFLFPAQASQCYYASGYLDPAPSMHLEASGAGVGLVYIDTGTEIISTIACIDDGENWNMCIPQIDNGVSWDNG